MTDLSKIRRNYLKGWFLIDLSSMIPLDTVGVIQARMADDDGEGGGGGPDLKGLRLMKLLKLMKLVRLVKVCVWCARRARGGPARIDPRAPPR